MVGEQRWAATIPVNKVFMKGHTLQMDESDMRYVALDPAIKELVDKMNAEMERLMRLLPDPPEGSHWEFEHQTNEDPIRNVAYFRVVAVLKENK